MTRPNTTEISTIMNNLLFSDGSSLLSRSSKPIIKSDNLGFSIDISGIDVKEAEQVRDRFISIVKDNCKEFNVSIVLTSQKAERISATKAKIHIEGASKVIIVSSGKGGVGKSTVAALLAYKLKAQGKKVGLLDADIYGPSIPQMFAITTKPDIEDKKMIPVQANGIFLNSIGFVVNSEASLSWRGPMISKAFYQLLSLTKWPNLDYLIIDMPPGTGDIHLSLLENYLIDGVLIITTPQKISEIDVDRSINLYRKFDTNILGVIENMSYTLDRLGNKGPSIFAGNGGSDLAKRHNLSLLAKLPINSELSIACDQGNNLFKFINMLDGVNSFT